MIKFKMLLQCMRAIFSKSFTIVLMYNNDDNKVWDYVLCSGPDIKSLSLRDHLEKKLFAEE